MPRSSHLRRSAFLHVHSVFHKVFRATGSLFFWAAVVSIVTIAPVSTSSAQQKPRNSVVEAHPVSVIEITDEVDAGMASYVERAVHAAEADSSAIVLHINTFGGLLDAGTRIRDAIIHARVPITIAFIDKRAISAGALIALAANKIVMSSGATIGAATPIYSTGSKASEKVVSYMRAEMRSTAEHNHRDPRVAEAMVDESLGLDSTFQIKVPPGKLLTLTTGDAIKVGYCDSTAETIQAAIAAAGVTASSVTNRDENAGDKLIRFFTSGLVSALLIMIGISGIFYSIKTGHFGLITLAALLALIIFFGGRYISSLAPVLAIVCFLGGLLLMLIEISPLPTFGLAGILGLGGMLLGLFLALAGDLNTLTPERLTQTMVTLAISLAGIIVCGALIIKYAPKSTWLQKFRNTATTADTSFYSAQSELVGMHGIAQTMLRPSGIVLVGDRKLDAVTSGAFVDPGTSVTVVEVSGNRIVVKGTDEQAVVVMDEGTSDGDGFGGRLPRA